MNFLRLVKTIFVFVASFVGAGVALALYRGENYNLPQQWPWLLVAVIAGASTRFFVDRRDKT